MEHIQGSDRNQLIMLSLESAIPQDSFVRVVDAFVDAIDLKSFGFAPRIRRGRLCGVQGRRATTLSPGHIAKAIFVRVSIWDKDHKETGAGSTNQHGMHVAFNGTSAKIQDHCGFQERPFQSLSGCISQVCVAFKGMELNRRPDGSNRLI